MAILAIETMMLYCPKCEKTYEDGMQRFCLNEGERLIPFSSGQTKAETKSVFTNVLKRKTNGVESKFASVPKFSQSGARKFSQPEFRPIKNSSMFKSETEFEFELELEPPPIEAKTFIKESFDSSEEILASAVETASNLDNEALNFEGEISPVTSNTLIGQILKNRYRIVELISNDEIGSTFLAENTEIIDEQVVVKIFTEGEDTFANKVFAAERISLQQINHPNIINVLDSDELPDGRPFIVTEFIVGETVKDYLDKLGQLNPLRTVRIVRQTAEALGEAHQMGVLHRNLKPENIIVILDENGAERVKISNFGASQEKLSEDNLSYKSPEQLEGKIANAASDNYSLAVITYQMLTNRLPFNASSVGDLIEVQRAGLRMRPSDVRFDLPPMIDDILSKALSFNSFDRYLKARDFGDEIFSEIIAKAPLENEEETEAIAESEQVNNAKPKQLKNPASLETHSPEVIASDVVTPPMPVIDDSAEIVREGDPAEKVKATRDLAWEKRSLDLPTEPTPRRNFFTMIGMAVLIVTLLGVWYYFINRPNNIVAPAVSETANQNTLTGENILLSENNGNVKAITEEPEAPPLPRSIKPPPDSVYFQNSKESLKGDAMKNFLGFSLYYPNDWQTNSIEPDAAETKSRSKFLDISKKASSGTPIEQMLISYYNSKGTYKADTEIFPTLVVETNATLKKIVPNYQMISEGKKTVNNGWQAYEVNFQGTGTTSNGEKIVLWGKRLFIPTALRGMKNGYVITMLATSLSKEVKNIDDVGVKGELSTILETFEPNQNF